jgi:glycerophosphoryl diester phosphodiesterase
MNPMFIAHRGGEAYAPENTVAAFALSIDYGITCAETDLRVCQSGEIVLLHDATVDRTTNGSGAVSDLTLDQLRALDAGTWFAAAFQGEYIPTLEQFFTRFGDQLTYFLEIKDPGRLEEKLVHSIEQFGLREHCIIIGMDSEALEKVKRLDPLQRVGYTAHEPSEKNIARALDMGAHHMGISPKYLSKTLVAECRARGLPVRSTHVHSDEDIRRALASAAIAIVHSDVRVLQQYL